MQTPESNLEPTDPNGPLPFTSSALLSLAYIRNCFDVFRTRKIITWNPPEIADVLRTLTAVDRNMASLLAAYHATNLLATLVKLGVQYFKHNQGVLWSIEATLCGLDSSIFLEKWLRQVHATMRDTPLTGMIDQPFDCDHLGSAKQPRKADHFQIMRFDSFNGLRTLFARACPQPMTVLLTRKPKPPTYRTR